MQRKAQTDRQADRWRVCVRRMPLEARVWRQPSSAPTVGDGWLWNVNKSDVINSPHWMMIDASDNCYTPFNHLTFWQQPYTLSTSPPPHTLTHTHTHTHVPTGSSYSHIQYFLDVSFSLSQCPSHFPFKHTHVHTHARKQNTSSHIPAHIMTSVTTLFPANHFQSNTKWRKKSNSKLPTWLFFLWKKWGMDCRHLIGRRLELFQ